MTILSASALDLDPAGCALLTSVSSGHTATQPRSPWLRASAGFVASTTLTVLLFVALASLL
jgi:hypothetical protein